MPLRSRITTDGLDRTPHRAFMRAMGLGDAAIAKPMIGVVSQKGETTPCNMTHGPQAEAAKEGVQAAGLVGKRARDSRTLDAIRKVRIPWVSSLASAAFRSNTARASALPYQRYPGFSDSLYSKSR